MASLTVLPAPDPATARPDLPPPASEIDRLAAELQPVVFRLLDVGNVLAAWGALCAYAADAAAAYIADTRPAAAPEWWR